MFTHEQAESLTPLNLLALSLSLFALNDCNDESRQSGFCLAAEWNPTNRMPLIPLALLAHCVCVYVFE